jgi:hypothetical protein
MSTLRAATIADLAGTGPATLTGQTAAKAWMNLNGTGTIAIRASANTSSATDNGTGDYTENFASALSDANYGWALGVGRGSASGNVAFAWGPGGSTNPTVSAFRIRTCDGALSALDAEYIASMILR